VQALPPCAHVPFWTGQVALLLHDFAARQVPAPMPAHCGSPVHGVTPFSQVRWLQVPCVHCATEVHDCPAGLLHTPQSAFARQRFPLLLQVPVDGQFALLVQLMLGFLLHVPLRIEQSLGEAQRLPLVLQ